MANVNGRSADYYPSLRAIYPDFSDHLWGVTVSDSDIGYLIWRDPLSRRDIDGRYGFADASNPRARWVDPNIVSDLGINLLSAENLRSGRVWRWLVAREMSGAL